MAIFTGVLSRAFVTLKLRDAVAATFDEEIAIALMALSKERQRGAFLPRGRLAATKRHISHRDVLYVTWRAGTWAGVSATNQ